MLFDPRLIFVSLWGIECLGQLLFGGVFGRFETETWIIVAVAAIAFLSGAQVTQQGLGVKYSSRWIEQRWTSVESSGTIPNKFKLLTIVIYAAAAFFVMQKIVEITGVADVARPLECLRLKIVADHITEREIAGLMKFFIFGVALSLCFLNDAAHSPRTMVILLCAAGLLSALATTGRLLLLMFFLALTYLMYAQRNWRSKEICASLIGFFLLFVSIAFITNKGPAEEWMREKVWSCKLVNMEKIEQLLWKAQLNAGEGVQPPATASVKADSAMDSSAATPIPTFSASDRLVWNAQTYFLASFAAFDHYVKTGEPHLEGGAFLPNAARSILNHWGADIAMRPAVNPVAEIAMRTNTYTALFPIYHDLGKTGVFVWFFFLGCLHQFLYRMSQNQGRPIFRYFFAISLYPLCMVIFEEAYASSPGFWAVFIFTPLLVRLTVRLTQRFFTPGNKVS